MASSAQIAELVRTQAGHAQERAWSCGPGALVNALAILGLDISEREVRAMADTSFVDGTDEHGLLDAIESLGFTAEVIWTSGRAGAWSRLVSHLQMGHPALLCVDQWDHWVAITGTDDGETVMMIDPAEEPPHEEVISFADLMRRWRFPDEDRPYYAIVVSP